MLKIYGQAREGSWPKHTKIAPKTSKRNVDEAKAENEVHLKLKAKQTK